MAPRAIRFFCFTLLLFYLLSQVHSEHKSPIPSRFFIRNLQGSHKGDKGNGILVLRNYLQRFGYLSSITMEQTSVQNDNFDDELDLDVECRNIINGTNPFHSQYVFFPGNPKWTKNSLTYAFAPATRRDGISTVSNALQKWPGKIRFKFSLTNDYSNADLKISFQRLEHGDFAPFDGPGRVLAHATSPMDGTLHYDGDENWSLEATLGTFHLETVGLHEIGHMLGLAHSQVREAIYNVRKHWCK
ncbi:hypothetical protein SLEP1_g20213 [Rubroshorea leprosula]|uniref:Peptidase metallopeptidase domain-containing protein n=1 Tax=Rubroshorea leprosula TaxID=152421 RepID=A0AAV5J1Y1_9ROSI|nr:hypothetical protein SLEP1_g20213 [Rubroshorea leprosula]